MKTAERSDQDALRALWKGMRQRCSPLSNNRRTRHYRERGTKVCAAWDTSFEAFAAWALANGYMQGLVIDREDNEKDYEPGNCRFMTVEANRRNSSNSRWWVVAGVAYPSANAAADALTVGATTVRRWCGQDPRRKSRTDCYTVPLYAADGVKMTEDRLRAEYGVVVLSG